MNVVAVVSDKRLDLFVQTAYVNIKKGNLSTPTGEQAPINTPEANSGTVSDAKVPQKGNDVNTQWSISDSNYMDAVKRKDGAAIDKLARSTGDNIRTLATVHLSEALATSGNEKTTDEHSHQWMDENGWIYRTAYLQDRNGNIYEATLNIADGRDRKILYDINNIRLIDKAKAADGVVSSTANGRDSHINGSSSESGAAIAENPSPGTNRNTASVSGDSIAEESGTVKQQFSLSEPDKAPKSFSDETDREYLDAVRRNDGAAIDRLVAQAAKDAGYNTPKLYHGTNAFGFTRFDPALGDGAIFATPSNLSAMTYSGETDRRSIGQTEYETRDGSGIYALYGKLGPKSRVLEFNANGKMWNDLEAPGELGLYGKQDTRSIAKAARGKGYRSIIIKNFRRTANLLTSTT